jgi:hypothetical protein
MNLGRESIMLGIDRQNAGSGRFGVPAKPARVAA